MEYYEVAEITLNLNSKGYEMGDEESSYMGPDYKKAICACDEALSNWGVLITGTRRKAQ